MDWPGNAMAILVFPILAAAIAAFFAVPWLWRKLEERRLAELCRARRAVVLSYDDGPGPALTPRLLDLLGQRGVKASFFMLGRNAAQAEALARRVIAEGHEVGSHSFDHSNAWKRDPLTVARDFDKGRAAMASLGAEGRFFRPPYGKLTIAQWLIERNRATRFAWWSVDSKDSWDRRPIADVTGEILAKGGGVVLMHDFDAYDAGDEGPPHPEHVLALTDAIIDCAEANGLKLMTLAELHGDKA